MLSLYESISAGFPSFHDNDTTTQLDLNAYLVKRQEATFLLRVSGQSMVQAGIHHNDIVVVDRSIEATHGKIVIASLNGELTVKRLLKKGQSIQLAAENPKYCTIEITEEIDFSIFGVVTFVIHAV